MRYSRLFAAIGAACLYAGMPAAAAAQGAAIPIEAYGALPAIEEAKLSRSGTYTAMLMTVNDQRQIMVLDAAGAPVQQFVVGDEKVRGIDWVGDEAILLRRTETGRATRRFGGGKREWMRGNILPIDDRRDLISVFADQRYLANNLAGFYGIRQVGDRWLGYFGGYRMGDSSGQREQILHYRPALYAVDMRTGETDQVAFHADENEYRDWIVGANGALVQFDVHLRDGKWTIKNPDGDIIARGIQDEARVNLVGFDVTGTAVIYSEYDRSDARTRYYKVPLAGGEVTEIWSDAAIHRINYDTNGHVLGMITTSTDVVMDDPAHQQVIEAILNAYPRSVVQLEDWTDNLSTVTFRTSGHYDSGSWYRYDAADKSRAMLGLERPYIQGQSIGKIETFDYSAADGLEIEGILTLPATAEAKNLPVVILPHGGPTSHDEPEFDWWAQAFAARGYAVLQPNFRGSTNRDEAFRRAGDGEWGRKMQTDISDGLAALADKGIVDASRACIVGASYGGYAALAGVTLQNGIYRCAVGVNGVYDTDEFFRHSFTGRSSVASRGAERMLGEGTDRKDISPRHHAGRADAPVLLIHGKDDTVVPYAQSVLMEDALTDAGKQVELITLSGEDHWLSQPETRTAMLRAAVDFVERHNPADR